MGGELHQRSTVRFQTVRRRHNTKCFCALRAMSNAMLAVKYAGAGPYPSRGFTACPWKICVAASRLPCLLCLYADGAMAGECFPFLSCSWNFCVRALRVPYPILFLHDKADPHTTKTFLDIRGSASVFAIREQRGAAVRRDAKPRGNTAQRLVRARRSPPGSSCGPHFICAALLLSAPRPRAGMSSGH